MEPSIVAQPKRRRGAGRYRFAKRDGVQRSRSKSMSVPLDLLDVLQAEADSSDLSLSSVVVTRLQRDIERHPVDTEKGGATAQQTAA